MRALVLLTLLASVAASAQSSYLVTVDRDTLRGDVEVIFAEPTGGQLVGWRAVVGDRSVGPDSALVMVLGETTYAVLPNRNAELSERVVTGPVNLYSAPIPTLQFISDFGPNSPVGLSSRSGMRFRPEVEFLQIGDGDLRTLSAGNLRLAFQDYPESIAPLDRHRTLGWVQAGLLTAGITSVLVGFTGVSSSGINNDLGEPTDYLSPGAKILIPAGLLVAGFAAIINPTKSRLRRESVEAYRRAQAQR